ncbi:RBP5 isoform 4, partial [Pongo abelii]
MPPNLTGYYRFVSQKNMEDYLQALSSPHRHQLGCAEDRAAAEAGQGDRPPGQPHDGEDAQHLPKLHCAVR